LKFIHFCERAEPEKYPALEIIPAFRELFRSNGVNLDEEHLSQKTLLLNWMRKNDF